MDIIASLSNFFIILGVSIFISIVVSAALLGKLRPKSRFFRLTVFGSVVTLISAWFFLA